MNLDSLCHTCGAALAEPTDARHPRCDACASSRPAARRRLSQRCHRNRLRAYRTGAAGFHRPADVRALWRAQRQRCAGCRRSLGPLYANPPGYHVDHVTPLSRGGHNGPANLQLLCPKCNVRKAAR